MANPAATTPNALDTTRAAAALPEADGVATEPEELTLSEDVCVAVVESEVAESELVDNGSVDDDFEEPDDDAVEVTSELGEAEPVINVIPELGKVEKMIGVALSPWVFDLVPVIIAVEGEVVVASADEVEDAVTAAPFPNPGR